jgi:hypothetical protein
MMAIIVANLIELCSVHDDESDGYKSIQYYLRIFF